MPMQKERFASPAAFNLILDWEKLRLEANLVQDKWVIGWGVTHYPDGKPVKEGDTCNVEQAKEWMSYRVLDTCVIPLNDIINIAVNQKMFDALVSWTYNIGEDAMRKSSLISLLNAGDYLAAAREFDRWASSPEKMVDGRITNQEHLLFEKGVTEIILSAKDFGIIV